MDVLKYLEPEVLKVREQAAQQVELAEQEARDKAELVEAGQAMAALLLERGIPTDDEVDFKEWHDVPQERTFMGKKLKPRMVSVATVVETVNGWHLFTDAYSQVDMFPPTDVHYGEPVFVTVKHHDKMVLLQTGLYAKKCAPFGATSIVKANEIVEPTRVKGAFARLAVENGLA